MKLKGKPVDLCIIQLYMPMTEHSKEVDKIHEMEEHLLDTEATQWYMNTKTTVQSKYGSTR